MFRGCRDDNVAIVNVDVALAAVGAVVVAACSRRRRETARAAFQIISLAFAFHFNIYVARTRSQHDSTKLLSVANGTILRSFVEFVQFVDGSSSTNFQNHLTECDFN